MTPTRTSLGYLRLAPGDPLSADGYAFQTDNPVLADLLGRLGAFTHKHDGHAALADPTAAATLAIIATGGGIPAATAIHVGYTLVDAHGGESLLNAPGTVTTGSGFADPTTAPIATPDTAAGTLLANTVSYAITVTDGLGGETAIGPPVTVVIPPGAANNEVVLSELTEIVTASSGGAGGAGWRMWRTIAGDLPYLIGTGAAATDNFTDNGIAGDCSVRPPLVGTTGGGNELTVVVPSAGQPAGASYFNLYACTDGAFASPCFLAQYPVASFDATLTFTSLTLNSGAPPVVSRCYPGANKIDPDTDMLAFPWRKTVANVAALPAMGNARGDVRLVLDILLPFVWDDGPDVWRPFNWHQRTSQATPITGLVATTETAAILAMVGKATEVFSITVDAACRLRLYPTAALAVADLARAASEDQNVASGNGCYFEHTFSGAGTKILTPTVTLVNQEGSPADQIAANVSVPAGTTVGVTLNGYLVEA